MTQVTHLLFDVGGVLIDDYSSTWKDVLDRVQLDPHSFHDIWMDIVRRFGSGQMIESDVWNELANIGAPKVSTDENVMGRPFEEQLTIHDEVLHTITQLRDNSYRIAILSNTIEPHTDVLRRHNVYEPFGNNVYLSQEIGIRKPDIKAYEYAVEHLKVENPSQIMFFDDRSENLIPANEVGMQTHLVTNEKSLNDFLLTL